MPFRRRSRGFRRGRSGAMPPSRKVWGGFSTREETSGAEFPGTLDNNEQVASWLLSDQDAYDFYDEPTVLRILLRMTGYAAIDTGDNNGDTWSQQLRAGIIVTRPDEADPNIPPLHNLLNPSLDWLWYNIYHFYHTANDVLSILSINAQGGDRNGLEDIRSRRKIPEGFGLSIQFLSVDTSLAPSTRFVPIVYSAMGRILYADH